MALPRVRFAPSPTGDLHVGDARIALFNWLLARRLGGTFILRIEDTHADPASAETIGGILDGLRWLGLTWDEGPDIGGPCEPYSQSARIERHRAAARRLLLEGHAYYCYCSSSRLRDARARAEAQGEAWQYDRTCLALSIEQVRALEADGVPRALRFKVPGGRAAFDDEVHGRIEFDGAHIEDFIVLGSDGEPASQLGVVVADAEMGITHVIRDEEHLPDTPAHVLLFQALGAPVPRFAHVPPLQGVDGKRLGSRDGATVGEYRRQGYLPEAVVNVLALLGWSPADRRDVMSAGELAERFSIEGIGSRPVAFDAGKLDWMNGQHLAQIEPAALAASLRSLLAEAGLGGNPLIGDEGLFHRLLALLRPRVTRLTGMVEQVRPIVEDVAAYEPGAVERLHLAVPHLDRHVRALVETLGATAPFDEPHVEAAVRRAAAAAGLEVGLLADAVRMAVTGRTETPDLIPLLALIGRERTVARLQRLLLFLSSRS